MIPMLFQGGLTGRWWCATKWKHIKDDRYEVLEKFDVTDQIDQIVANALAVQPTPNEEGGSVGA